MAIRKTPSKRKGVTTTPITKQAARKAKYKKQAKSLLSKQRAS